MNWPSPTDPKKAPVWDNYIVAQLAQACLGLLPEHAVAVGVVVHGPGVMVIFQMTEIEANDQEDIQDIIEALETLVGPDVKITTKCEVLALPDLSRYRDARWTYKRRG
ncbi:hypothetical protein [Cellulosimicrobium sp. Marseille-Q4280]|uniref:hypothetical protein n=1 Tax=Cellulosimicrobium sp. Marseille-Q4280 TaxID=2937992 RepID=UPI00203D63F6|nr:hypothetical protein [Cellulosimicrobium sp. Marseille-Q4280]